LSKKGTGTFPSTVSTLLLSEGGDWSVISFIHYIIICWPSGPFSPKASGSN
jgi:hypothetical protein